MYEEQEKSSRFHPESFSEQSGRILREMILELSNNSQRHRHDWMTRFVMRLSSVVESSHVFVAAVSELGPPVMETIAFASQGILRDNIRYTIDRSPIQRILVHRDNLIIESELAGYFPDDPMISSWQVEACVCLPLISESEGIIGVLAWFHQKPHHYHSSTLAVFRVLARLAAMELRNNHPVRLFASKQLPPASWDTSSQAAVGTGEQQSSLRMRLDAYQDIAQGFAHEIRNPIHLIVNAAKLMEKEVHRLMGVSSELAGGAAEHLLQHLDLIQHGGQRLDYLVSTIWERLSLRQQKSRFCHLNQILQQQVEFIHRQFASAMVDVQITQDFEQQIPLVYLCPEVLGKVISNMLLNALQAFEEKSMKSSAQTTEVLDEKDRRSKTIEVASRFDGHEIFVEIVDNGIGLKGHPMVRVFDPFFSTKPPGKGLGLGLSLSYQIITEDYGGQIQASRTEDDRTLFRICLPYQNLSGCRR